MAFKHPNTILVSGPTGCGKTQFVINLILKNLITPNPQKILWIYSEWQGAYDLIKFLREDVKFIKGFQEGLYEEIDPKYRNLMVLDDQMHSAGDNKTLGKLFTEGSHHRNLTIIYIVQNLFDKGKFHRTASLNSKYMVIFKNPRDKSQITSLGRQMFPGSKFLEECYHDATMEPFGYLVIDLCPETLEEGRVKTKILNPENTVYYAPL